MTHDQATQSSPALLLWLELLALFVFVPVVMAVFLPPTAMFPVLLGFTAVGLVLLHFTPGFHWRELGTSPKLGGRALLGVAFATALVSLLVLSITHPDALFAILRRNPAMWLMIMLLYPIVSAIPQEVVFRVLFFRRYAPILPEPNTAIVFNAALFSLAHLLYWSWVVALMTFAGGLLFAWAYKAEKSFLLAVLLHAVAGNVLFTMGMGVYFYSGAVERPF